MTINKLIRELEKCYSKKSNTFYASIDHLAEDIYKTLKEVQNDRS